MPDKPVHHALIVTVGQTAAPIAAAITQHVPDGVLFIASQGSHGVVAGLTREFSGDFKHHLLLLDNPESLAQSYSKALEALARALDWEARAITADITGGTKPMVAGLTLALTGRGVTFSYVGGNQRDAYGRVVDGAEQVRVLEDPTARYHVREWNDFQQAWNGWRFVEAAALLTHLQARPLSRSEARFFRHLQGVVEALRAWDRFHHVAALGLLNAHLEPALAVAEAWRHGAKVRVLAGLEAQQAELHELVTTLGKPSRTLLADLLANAGRRAEAGRYDDALARLYRAVELAAEVDVCERHGLVLRQSAGWPEGLPGNLRARAGELSGLKESLDLAFDIDVFFGASGTLSQRLSGDYNRHLKPLLAKRHASILAHGLNPVEKEDYEALRDYLADRGLKAAPLWPRW